MKVLLIDADRTGFPNLALMKLSAWHRKRGDQVWLNSSLSKPDRVYISCAFRKNRNRAIELARAYEAQGCKVELGGYGVSDRALPDEIEHIKPDYELYGIDYSMGFTTRGCIRKCAFCDVWRNEGELREHASIEEFWNRHHDKILLLDNNFLASPLWREKLEFLIARRLKVCFNQGLDLRLIDREKALWLRRVRYYDNEFRKRRLYFAWDRLEDEDAIMRGISLLRETGVRPAHMLVYMLCGFNTSFHEDRYRFEKLNKLGVLPFVMIYDDRQDDLRLRAFRDWVNSGRTWYKRIPFSKYERLRLKGQRVLGNGFPSRL